MCGIIGYCGKRCDVRSLLIKGVSRMEYRGYDSAGMCLQTVGTFPEGSSGVEPGSLHVSKAAGQVGKLAAQVDMVRLAVLLVYVDDPVTPPAPASARRYGSQFRLPGSRDLESSLGSDDLAASSPALARRGNVTDSPAERRRNAMASSSKPTKNSDTVLPPEYRVGSSTLHEEPIVSSVLICVSRQMTIDKLLETVKTTFATETGIKVPTGSKLYVEGLVSEKPLDANATVGSFADRDLFALRLAAPRVFSGAKAEPGRVDDAVNEGGRFPADLPTVSIGLAHTRWATHGEPSAVNAHPHLSNNKKVAVVHNGIIENKDELQEDLERLGYHFFSQTDTEVIPILIEYELSRGQSIEVAIYQAISKMRGAYGVALTVLGDDRIFAFRLGSPLCIGVGDGEYFVASEPSAFLSHTDKKIDLEDYEVAILSRQGVTINKISFSKENDPANKTSSSASSSSSIDSSPALTEIPDNGMTSHSAEQVQSRTIRVPFNLEEVRKGKYKHFMIKEIHEQPRAIQNTISSKASHVDGLEHIDIMVPPSLSQITFLACGTSHHAAMIGSYIIENHVGIQVNCQYASEYINKACLLTRSDLAIAISQSGETADTREALKLAIAHGASVAGIVNVVGSQIARIAGKGIYLHAGPEIGVASTKAFTCQVGAINLLSAFLSRSAKYRMEVTRDLLKVPEVIAALLADKEWMDKVEAVAATFDKAENALFLGRGIDFPLALEGSLKLKEISYIHAEGYPAGEMKHGPIALITEALPVVFIVGAGGYDDIHGAGGRGRGVYEKIVSNMEEVKARKGKIICITDLEDPSLDRISDHVIKVPFIGHTVSPMIKVLPLQLIAYHAAVRRGLDPDKPRNLAKSVTVL